MVLQGRMMSKKQKTKKRSRRWQTKRIVGRKHRDVCCRRVATLQGSTRHYTERLYSIRFDMNRTRQQRPIDPFQARNPTQDIPSNRPFFASRIHITSSPTHRHWPQHLQSVALMQCKRKAKCKASARQHPFLPHLAAGGWLNRTPV